MNEEEEEEQPTTSGGASETDNNVAAEIEREIADDSTDVEEPSPEGCPTRWLKLFRIEKQGLRYKLEAIARDCFALVIAMSLCVFGVGVVVPPSMGATIIEVTGLLSLMLPSLMFAFWSLHATMFGFVFLSSVFITVLLAAATVSDGLFVVVFGLITFLLMGTFFDSVRTGADPQAAGLVSMFAGISIMLALSYKHMVQYGVSINFVPGDDTSNLNPSERAIVDASVTLFEAGGTISFDCPEEAGIFAGQTCTITNATSSSEPGMLTASVNGGLYLVAALWTEKGLNNTFAFVRNFFIATGWIFLSFVVAYMLTPPVRKFRTMLRKFIIPGTLEAVAALLESFNKDGAVGGNNVVESDREQLAVAAEKISPKKIAGMLAYEPRLCPTVDHIPHMETLLQHIQSAVLLLFNYRGFHAANNIEEPDHSETVKVLRKVASAVRENDVSILDGVDVPSSNRNGSEEQGQGLPDMSPSGVLDGIASSIYSSSRVWLDVYNNNKIDEENKHRVAVLNRTLKAGFSAALCSCGAITGSWPFIGFRLLRGKEGAGLEKVGTRRVIRALLWSVKWTAGVVALLCIELFSPEQVDLVIKRNETLSPALLGTLWSWSLFAYLMAWQVSMEGTIKKGIMRALGTCLGGFATWIGIMLCSLSYNGTNPVNPYGWIAYVTVCLFIGNFAGKGPGITAFLGMEYDTPFFSFYFIMQLFIVGMDVFYGSLNVNAAVANRIAANLAGIAMSMLVSIIPPYYSCKDPLFTLEYCEEMQKFHHSVAREYIETHDVSKESVLQMKDDIANFRKKAEMILIDGGRWVAFPYFQLPPELKRIFDILVAEEGYLVATFTGLTEMNVFQYQNYDLLKPALEEVLEGKDKTAPAIAKYLNEAGESNKIRFLSYLNRMTRLQVLREKLDSFEKPAWYSPFF